MSIRQNQNETTNKAHNLRLKTLIERKTQAPFDDLLDYLQESLPSLLVEDESKVHACMFNNSVYSSGQCIEFVPQANFEEDVRYYEQIIFEERKVPSRDNWHDFFNALIWQQMTTTKQYFNQQHVAQIRKQNIESGGIKTRRSAIRDRITHFDECGLVLFTCDSSVETLIEEHQWQTLFVEKRHQWHQSILPIIVGHALWEMLLSPFIGLTAKVLIISLSLSELAQLKQKPKNEFYRQCDSLVLKEIIQKDLLSQSKPWKPLPLLGIANWSPFAQDKTFYQNTQYFMPKNKK